jgi:hypothetical protein
MQWYDPLLILTFFIGVFIIAFSHYHQGKASIWGWVLILVSLVVKAFIWFESLI